MWEERLPTAREAPRRKDVTSWLRQMLGLLAPFRPCVAFVRVYNACDLDSLVETFYTEDAHLLLFNHPCVSGRPQVRRLFQGLLEAGVGELSAETIQIDVSGDLAYCLGTHAFGMSAANRGKFLEVYRRQGERSRDDHPVAD